MTTFTGLIFFLFCLTSLPLMVLVVLDTIGINFGMVVKTTSRNIGDFIIDFFDRFGADYVEPSLGDRFFNAIEVFLRADMAIGRFFRGPAAIQGFSLVLAVPTVMIVIITMAACL